MTKCGELKYMLRDKNEHYYYRNYCCENKKNVNDFKQIKKNLSLIFHICNPPKQYIYKRKKKNVILIIKLMTFRISKFVLITHYDVGI